MHIAAILFHFGLFFLAVQPAMAAKKVTSPLCEHLVRASAVWTDDDYELVEKSKNGPVLSGFAHPTPEFAKRWGWKLTDKINEWHVYFLADVNEPCFDSPSETIKKVGPLFNAVAEKQARAQDIFGPLHIFMTCQDFKFDIPTRMPGKWHENLDDLKKTIGGAAMLSQKAIRFRIGERIQEYDFEDYSPIIILKAGNEQLASAWSDDFVMAHEAAHVSEHNSFLPKYFKEGRADFIAAVSSSRTSSPMFGPERDVANPEFRNLDEFFSKISPTANYQQLGSFVAHALYKIWPHIHEHKLEHGSSWYFKRVMDLIKFESPDVLRDGMNHDPINKVEYTKADATRSMNFLAAVTVQVAVEQKWPVELTKAICEQWSPLGVRGPFKRYRVHDVQRDGSRVLGSYDEEFKNLNFPEQWNTCFELVNFLKN